MSPHLHHPFQDRQLLPPVTSCPTCGQELYAGETLFQDESGLLDGKTLCPACFRRWVERQLQTHPATLAMELGCQVLPLPEEPPLP